MRGADSRSRPGSAARSGPPRSAGAARPEFGGQLGLLPGFAVCPSGLEGVAEQELQRLEGIAEASAGRGGVSFRATAEGFARANLWCRVPTRLLLLLDQFRLRSADDITKAAAGVAWERFMAVDLTFRVDVNQARPPTADLNKGLAALKVKDGIVDRFRERTGRRPSVDTHQPDHRIWLFIDGEKATLSIDTSGEPLFKRGWRRSKGEAPLRENLAAALAAMAFADGDARDDGRPAALLDPMCGSGTLLIEAYQRLARLAPGYCPAAVRSFACEGYEPGSPFAQVDFAALRGECKDAWEKAEHAGPSILRLPQGYGRDISPEMVEAARSNAGRALPSSVSACIQWEQADFLEAPAPAESGVALCNPPYGQRIRLLADEEGPEEGVEPGLALPEGVSDIPDMRRLSESMKRSYAGWAFWMLSDDRKLESSLRLKATRRIPVYNGDLDCRWMRFDMIAGSARKADGDPQPAS